MTTILIVDDEVPIAMTTAEMVADFGYHPLEANSGAEALEILQADNEIGVLITDYSMPRCPAECSSSRRGVCGPTFRSSS